MAKEQVLRFKPARRLEEVNDEHCERMQEREHRPRSCDDSTRRCDSQAGRDFRKGQEVYTTERGFRRWTSVLGAMTGMGGDVFIIDDPLKPVDALSEVKREAVNQWYINTLLSRLD